MHEYDRPSHKVVVRTSGAKSTANVTFWMSFVVSTLGLILLWYFYASDSYTTNFNILPFIAIRFVAGCSMIIAHYTMDALGTGVRARIKGTESVVSVVISPPYASELVQPLTPHERTLLDFLELLTPMVAAFTLFIDSLGLIFSIMFWAQNPKNPADSTQYAMGQEANITGFVFYLLLLVLDAFHVPSRPDPLKTSETSWRGHGEIESKTN